MARIPVPKLAFSKCIRVSKYLQMQHSENVMITVKYVIITADRMAMVILLLYSRRGVFYFTMLVRVIEVLFLVQLRGGGVALCADGDTLVEAVHVNAVTWKSNNYILVIMCTQSITDSLGTHITLVSVLIQEQKHRIRW